MTMISYVRKDWDIEVAHRDDDMLFDGERTCVEGPTHAECIEDLHWHDACPQATDRIYSTESGLATFVRGQFNFPSHSCITNAGKFTAGFLRKYELYTACTWDTAMLTSSIKTCLILPR